MDQQHQMPPPRHPHQMFPPPMAPAHQPTQQQWGMIPLQPAPVPMWGHPHQPPPQPMWNQPPPQQVPAQYAAPVQFQPAQMASTQPASAYETRALWIGDLQYWMDENYIINTCLPQIGEVVSVKLIRNKQTGQLEGYGFIEFATRAAAERVLQTYSGTLMPNTEQHFRLNWAFLGAGEKPGDDGSDYTIFVGDLAADVSDYMLQETFRSRYPSVQWAKVVTDRTTGQTKGYGFVRFGDPNEKTRAMSEMNGMFCSTRAMRIGPTTTKKMVGDQQYPSKASYQLSQGTQFENDPNNTTIFVGGLDSNVSEDHLRQVFNVHGELVHVNIPMGKRCGFVQFANRACAEDALTMLQGTQLGAQNIRLSWGHSPSTNKPVQQQQQQDPNQYAYGAYPGYAN